MCAPTDIAVTYHVRDTFTQRPTIYLHDCVPGGLGLSDRVYEMDAELFLHALAALRDCPCKEGCPACVGAAAGREAKAALLDILAELCRGAA